MKAKLSKKIKFSKKYRFRILSGVLFLAFLVSTWLIFYQKPKYPEALHMSLQEQLKQIIQTTLLKQQPLARRLQFHKMWTETAGSKDQIQAFFHYSFDDSEGDRLFVKGQATMIRKTVDNVQDLWRVIDIQTDNDKIEFLEPIVLLPGHKEDSSSNTDVDKELKEDESADNR